MRSLKSSRKYIQMTFLLSFFVLMSAQILYAMDITIPKGGQTYVNGSPLTITWDCWSVAEMAVDVTIELLKGSTVVGTIGRTQAIRQSYNWSVGWTQQMLAPADSGYRIRTHGVDPLGKEYWGISGTFTISGPPPATDQPSSSKTWATDQPSHSMALKKGDVMITEFKMVPLKDKGNHLQIIIKFSNQLSEKVKNLRLILVKNHLQVKEWKPLGLGPKGKSQVRYDDDLPQPFKTNNYIAILTTDLSSSLPPAETVLDRKEASYRRSGTVEGGL